MSPKSTRPRADLIDDLRDLAQVLQSFENVLVAGDRPAAYTLEMTLRHFWYQKVELIYEVVEAISQGKADGDDDDSVTRRAVHDHRG